MTLNTIMILHIFTQVYPESQTSIMFTLWLAVLELRAFVRQVHRMTQMTFNITRSNESDICCIRTRKSHISFRFFLQLAVSKISVILISLFTTMLNSIFQGLFLNFKLQSSRKSLLCGLSKETVIKKVTSVEEAALLQSYFQKNFKCTKRPLNDLERYEVKYTPYKFHK